MRSQGTTQEEIRQKLIDYRNARNRYYNSSPEKKELHRTALFALVNIDDLSVVPSIAAPMESKDSYQYKGVVYNLGADKHNKHNKHNKHISRSETITEKIKNDSRFLSKSWKSGKETTDATFNSTFAKIYRQALEITIKTIVDSGRKCDYVRFNRSVGWDTGFRTKAGEETDVVQLYYEGTGSHIRPKANSWLQNSKIEPIIALDTLKADLLKVSESSVFKSSKTKSWNTTSNTQSRLLK